MTAPTLATTWVRVCALEDLAVERGAAALVDDVQVALVRLVDDTVLAVQQLDPFCGSYVMSRGIVGSRAVDGVSVPTLASPMYKQVFDLRTGSCLDTVGRVPLDGQDADLRTWPVRVVAGVVEVGAGADAAPGAGTTS
ncbi:nitrite reductase small subunit NirD [Sanguibacter massiliensis]|uniref:nitrite reductase small subunit NirD n=1 Tax=Sanguibacter massiliensis TaxID=1973217 RepID=UPI000C8393E6|nr:nitrite reductase small subunit NirD [Sanguibacter massiliensis]